MKDLASRTCFACEGGTPPMKHDEIVKYHKEVNGEWEVIKDHSIKRKFKFKDFKEAMKFVNNVADIANHEGHHPDIYIFYNIVDLELFTHAVKGLSENDFIMAAKIDKIA
jgi:4a-hydroxytetrahydrobiopterin dehydratase